MTPERYQQIDRIFQTALVLDPGERRAYLDEACGADEKLRDEVESLITSDEGGLSFIEEPAFTMAARVLASDEPAFAAGTQIDRYKVISSLGSGGMGEVYLAHDERLNRKIALKLLPAHFTTNQERMWRFQQEARMASALNHPNIITIHEIGQVENRNFIATEFVDGETLRQHLKRGALSVPESLDIAIQICRALVAAHNAGIVHRDIKPENIMLRHDGYVKVLDFGLAKLTGQREQPTQGDLSDRVDFSSGLLMGTVRYMSPEQAGGLLVDVRTDVWSLGVVLYEMLTGCAPFEGITSGDLIASILKHKPAPLTTLAPNTPVDLQRIVAKALEKDRDERYESIKAMLVDLESLENASGQINALPIQVKKRLSNSRPLATLAIVSLLTTGLGLTVYKLRRRTVVSIPPPNMKITTLSNGGAWVPAISPDGKYVAYVANNANGELAVWIKTVATASAFQLVAPAGVNYGAPVFSRDGSYLYYSVQDMNNMSEYYIVDYYRIPIGGGDSRKILSNVRAGVSFSPDGNQIAFNRISQTSQTDELLIANPDGTAEHVIASRRWPEHFWGAAWSPDGQLIAFGARNRDGNNFYNTFMAVPVNGGPEQLLTSNRWMHAAIALWLGDGSGLLVTGIEEATDPEQIYSISYPSGEVSQVTHDTNSYSCLQVTADSRTLVAEIADTTSNIWVAPDGDASRARQITTGGKDGIGGLAWTPDGKIIHSPAGKTISIINSDGSNPRQLNTDDIGSASPALTPDGRYLLFAARRNHAWGIWRADMDGRNPTLLANSRTVFETASSTDGRWVFFHCIGSTGQPSVCRVALEGGAVDELTHEYSYYPAVSPDGNWVAYFTPSETKMRLRVIPSAGGPPVKTFDVAPETDYITSSDNVLWTADGRYLTYIKNEGDTSNIWGQPFRGGVPQRLTNFSGQRIFKFAWSPDGKQLAVARGEYNRQIVLLTNFR
jgi:serine/threonine protein kinase